MIDCRIGIIGLGYVGLPLAVAFGQRYPVIGFDVNFDRVNQVLNGIDVTNEVSSDLLGSVLCNDPLKLGLLCTSDLSRLKGCNVYIVTVPTPINKYKSPDLTYLLKASEMVGSVLSVGDLVIYESTVYPGCTEEDCVPVLEAHSGLKFNVDFFCGYSPERVNVGDRINTLANIKKVTSGSTSEIAQLVDDLYKSIIVAGTHKAPNIKVAEASKAIENAQRDVNISFVNELALIFDRMGIDTNDVLDAAGTKWNFLRFNPGLVGGHCIGVDPYYLAHKAECLGYYPQVILSGRRVNDYMGTFVANKIVKLLIQKKKVISGSRALILGMTFKENCPDIRNSKVIDIVNELKLFDINVDVFDPHADKKEVRIEYGINLIDELDSRYDVIVLVIPHVEFLNLKFENLKMNCDSIIFDLKGVLNRGLVDARL